MFHLKYITGLIACLLLMQSSVFSQISSPSVIQDDKIEISGITTDAQIYSLSPQQKLTTHQYFDGLGRPIQSIKVAGSPLQKDIIDYTAYNSLGQALYNYLPYVGPNGSGGFRTSAPTEQTAYYSNGLSDKVTDDAMPWSQKIIEGSPLLRIISAGMNGAGFQPGQHNKTVNYRSNNNAVYANDAFNGGIRQWNYDGTSTGYYVTGSLGVVEVTDEAGNITDIYKDANGRNVLQRQIISATVIDGTTESCLDTYYIYDDAGELLFIVPPKALTAIRNANANPWSVSLATAASLSYFIIYDSQGRMVQKKLPGGDWAYIVYDPMNRPVLIQDGNMRAISNSKWSYIKYDSKGRVVSEGIYTDAVNGTNITSMQNYVNSLSGTTYSTYSYEEKVAGGSAPNYYTNRIFPTSNQNGSALQDLIYNYYDNYDFNDDGTADYSYVVQGLTNEASPTALTRSAATGVFKKTLSNDAGTLNVWLHTITFYDKRGNIIQQLTNNHTNTAASDLKTAVPDFIGKTMQTKAIKTVNSVTTTILTTNNYDNLNRLITIDQSNNGAPSVRIGNYIYNELGQLVNKKLHSTDNINFLQNVDFRYNINGKLTSINNATLSVDNTNYTNSDANDIFGEEILYEKGDPVLGNTGSYNGNISAVKWKDLPPVGNTNERSYTYGYDQLNRLTNAHYAEWNTASSNWSQAVGYNDENVTKYDLMGNMEGLTRYSNNTQIDNLTYSINGNLLSNVTDATTNTAGFNGSITTAYSYDPNGTLISDPKKSITYAYNPLNKLDKISFSNNNYIRYTYDAAGVVLRKEVYTSSTASTVTYDYVDGFVYQNAALSYISTAEGRVRNNSGTLVFEYMIRDHLGNVRVSFDGTGTSAVVRQENSYYPFGMNLPGNYAPTQANNLLFNNGSEWQNDFSNLPDLYQTGNRYYDAELGRFMAVDPLAFQTSSLSSYQYAGNNPLGLNDPSGLRMIPPPNDGMSVGPGSSDVLWGDDGGYTGPLAGSGGGGEAFYDPSDLTVLFDDNNPGDAGSAAAAYLSILRASGMLASGDTKFIQLFYESTWGQQASNISAYYTFSGTKISFTETSNGNTYTDYSIDQGAIANFLSLYDDYYGSMDLSSSHEIGFSQVSTAVGLTFDAHNMAWDGAAYLTKKLASPKLWTEGLETTGKVFGVAGAAFGGLVAGKNMWDDYHAGKGVKTSDVIGVGLSAVAIALVVINPVGLVWVGVTLAVDAATIVNDSIAAGKGDD